MTILELFMIILTVSLVTEMLVIAGCITYMASLIRNFIDTMDSIRMWTRDIEYDIASIDRSLNCIAHKDDIADV